MGSAHSNKQAVMSFIKELKRRKVIRVAIVYAVAAWLLIEVSATIFPMLRLPEWTATFVTVLVMIGFPLALILAWAFELTPGGIRREEQTADSPNAKPESNSKQYDGTQSASIAVLPFVDMSPKQDQGYFCDGIAEEILNQLCRISDLRVASRTGSFQFRGNGADIAQIGQRLNVQTVLEGSVRKSGDQLRVTAQLINTEDGYHLWSERFDKPVSDIFAVQDQIADSIAKALRLTIDPVTKQFMHGGRTKVVKAYEFYLRAWSHFYGFSGIHLRRARQMFQQAVEIDSEFARAWAGLAATDAFHCIYVRRLDDLVAEAVEASRRAVELCPTLPETQSARGLALIVENDYAGAETCFQEALRFDPNHYETLYFYARACVHQGRFEEAAALYGRAAQARPEDYEALLMGSVVLDSLGRAAEQRRWIEKGLHLARQHLEAYPDDARAMCVAAIAYSVLGDVEAGRKLIDNAVALEPDEGPVLYNAACFYARAGDKDKAIEFLERGVELGIAGRSWLENDADFKSLRSDPRFKVILSGLPE
jgi:TolB-like protein/tetratricopeptide (TPR) repeat protein